MSKKRRGRGRSGNNGKGKKRAKGAATPGSDNEKVASAAAVQVGDAINAVLLEKEGAHAEDDVRTGQPDIYGAALLKALVRGVVISSAPQGSNSSNSAHRTDMTVERFFKGFWGKKPVAIRPSRAVHEHLGCRVSDIREWFRTEKLVYGRDLDVTNYIDGERHTYNDEHDSPDATEEKVIDKSVLAEGKSLRVLRPQQYSRPCWRMLSCLESYFGRGGGANLYLTPGSNQGFAGHYDDIEAILVQVEGRKAWTVYREYSGEDPEAAALFPKNPRFSSGNFTSEQLKQLNVAFHVTLEPGDVLYLPRGAVHHARTPDADEYSVHVTFSFGQLATYADLLSEAIPRAIQLAIDESQPESDAALRESLPIGYQRYAGVMHSDKDDDPRRQEFLQKVASMFSRVLPYLPIDSAADDMARKFLHDRHALVSVAAPFRKQKSG